MRKLNTIFLMLAVNLGIILTLSFLFKITGLERYLQATGVGYQGLAIFCLFFGMGASFLSLLLSKTIVKWRFNIEIVDGSHPSAEIRRLYETVRHLANKAGLPKTPELGIYESPEVNAFATGPSKDSALVAVSTGLLSAMEWDEIEGVLGHELTHVVNGDMVRMTLLQGVVNALVMFVSRIVAQMIMSALRGDRRDSRGGSWFMYLIVVQLLETALGLLGLMIVAWYSRVREFRADRGGAQIAGRDRMIHALEALKARLEFVDQSRPDLQAFKISSGREGFWALIATHPSLDDRIEALRTA